MSVESQASNPVLCAAEERERFMSASVREAKRVVLCDDHEIVREAIKARMADSSIVEIVGEAGNGRDVVDVVKELEPDVLIIDVELPKRDGIEATKEVLKVRPRTKVIIFTAHAQPDLLALALRAGASGYVLKSAPAEDIARAVKAVTGGGTFLGGDFAGGKPSEVEKLLELSPRERQILELLAEGLRVKEIAERLQPQPGDRPHPRAQRDRQARGRHPHRGGRARGEASAISAPAGPLSAASTAPTPGAAYFSNFRAQPLMQ